MRGVSSRFFLLGLLLLFMLPFFSAETLTSEANVSYDSGLIRVFEDTEFAQNLFEDESFIGVEIIGEEVFTRVTVFLRDTSGINVTGTKEERRKLTNAKIDWFEQESEKILDEISESQVQSIDLHPEGFRALISKEAFDKLLKSEMVSKISWEKEKPKLTLEETAALINADNAWSSGYRGNGVNVCIIDSGIDRDYYGFSSHIIEEKCYNSDSKCPNNLSEDNSAGDAYGHGTKMAGIIIAENQPNIGIANETDLYVVRVTDENGDFSSNPFTDIGNAIDWCRTQEVDVISMSFRFGPYSSGNCINNLNSEINTAYGDNIALISATGNDNQDDKIGYPACNSQVISVGATYDAGDGTQEVDWCDETGGTLIFGVFF